MTAEHSELPEHGLLVRGSSEVKETHDVIKGYDAVVSLIKFLKLF